MFSDMAESIIVGGAYKVTRFLSDKLTVKATRRRYKMDKGRPRKNAAIEIMFTVGRPNYEERERIKQAKRGRGTLDTLVYFKDRLR